MDISVSLTVNGKPVAATLDPRMLLVQLLRERLGLTGTHVGCDTAQCGACTVWMDGRAIKSCNIVAMQAEGANIITIEGVAKADGTLHPMQEMFREHHALQCGFCTPGMVMSAIDLVKNFPNPTEQQIREQLAFTPYPFEDVGVRRRIGYAPEHEKTWDELTPIELVSSMAELAGVPRSRSKAAAEAAVFPVEAQMADRAPACTAWLMAAVMPRSLKEPVGLAPSYFSHTSHPTSSLRVHA